MDTYLTSKEVQNTFFMVFRTVSYCRKFVAYNWQN